MCLLILAHQLVTDRPLVVAANRDEFHNRPTAQSQFWAAHPDLLAGQDLELGGTWMGVTRTGRFAAVTNFRDPAQTLPAARSRGELPLDFLVGAATPAQYLSEVAERARSYAGFNLLVGAQGELWYYGNNSDRAPERLPPGIYGLSNARLDTPWPKVVIGKDKLRQLQAEPSTAWDHDALSDLVSDRRLADATRSAAAAESSPQAQMEHLLSAQFIVMDGYGTRSTTTFWLQSDGAAHWREQRFDAQGQLQGEVLEDFSVNNAG